MNGQKIDFLFLEQWTGTLIIRTMTTKPITIQQAVKLILSSACIDTKDQFDEWCGGKLRKRLYTVVALLAMEEWTQKGPILAKARVRWCYEEMLEGYALHH